MKNIVDSSGWLAYFADRENAQHFAAPLSNHESLIVPVITIYEVFKVALREVGEKKALQITAAMQRGTVIDLTATRALSASRLALQYKLPMADSIILATASEFDAVIWTQDVHFQDITGVKFFPQK